MAFFVININQQGGNLDANGLRMYYGTVSSVPFTSAGILALPYSKEITKTTYERTIDTLYKIHVVAIPNNIIMDTVIDIGNSYEDVTEDYILLNNNIGVEINGTTYTYAVYAMTTGRTYQNSTKHFTYLQNV